MKRRSPVAEDFTIYLERIDDILISAIHPKCFSCRTPFEIRDGNCVHVAVPEQPALRFHRKYCAEHFTLGLSVFVDNLDDMVEVEGRLQ